MRILSIASASIASIGLYFVHEVQSYGLQLVVLLPLIAASVLYSRYRTSQREQLFDRILEVYIIFWFLLVAGEYVWKFFGIQYFYKNHLEDLLFIVLVFLAPVVLAMALHQCFGRRYSWGYTEYTLTIVGGPVWGYMAYDWSWVIRDLLIIPLSFLEYISYGTIRLIICIVLCALPSFALSFFKPSYGIALAIPSVLISLLFFQFGL